MEYTFVELMEDIRSDTGKYIGVGEVLPKGVIDRTQTFSVKLPRLFVQVRLRPRVFSESAILRHVHTTYSPH